MTASGRKHLAGALLALCIGVQLLESSGRWDQSLRDANDEAGIVAAVLCVGVAIAIARTLIARVRFTRSRVDIVRVHEISLLADNVLSLTLSPHSASPPAALRI